MNTEEFTRALEKAIESKGEDYYYSDNPDSAHGCEYLKYGKDGEILGPGCLIGHALINLGIEAFELRKREGKSAISVLGDLTDLHPGTIFAAREAQKVQDEGYTWGSAMEAYRRELERPN